jgi:hypothetical protein
LPDIAIIVPWAGGCEYREAAWRWVQAQYTEAFPDWPILTGQGDTDPWVKATAVVRALATCDAETVIMADADVWCDEIAEAVHAVRGGAEWAVPHMYVHRLDRPSTVALIEGASGGQTLTQRAYRGVLGGGIVVLSRQAMRAVPVDPRFEGWGQEDESWGIALRTMLDRPWRGDAQLLHLYHPPQPRLTRRKGSVANWALYRRYREARLDTNAMTTLLREAQNALQTHQPALHANPKGG